MTRTTRWLAVGAALLFLAAGCGKKDEAAKPAAGKQSGDTTVQASKPQTTCPVMGGKIDRSLYVDVQGKRIYVCCDECVAAVKKEPAKYLAKAQADGVVLEDAPK